MAVTIPVGFGQMTVKWRFTGATRDSVVVIGYDPPTVDPGAHATAIHGILVAASRPCNAASMIVGWSYVGVSCTEMDDAGPLTAEFPGLVDGSRAGQAITPNVAMLIRKVTASGGRRNRGRIFTPPTYVLESEVDIAGLINATPRGVLGTMWNGVRTDMATAGFPWVIFHGAAPFTPTPVTNLVTDSIVATQRRRLRK